MNLEESKTHIETLITQTRRTEIQNEKYLFFFNLDIKTKFNGIFEN